MSSFAPMTAAATAQSPEGHAFLTELKQFHMTRGWVFFSFFLLEINIHFFLFSYSLIVLLLLFKSYLLTYPKLLFLSMIKIQIGQRDWKHAPIFARYGT